MPGSRVPVRFEELASAGLQRIAGPNADLVRAALSLRLSFDPIKLGMPAGVPGRVHLRAGRLFIGVWIRIFYEIRADDIVVWSISPVTE